MCASALSASSNSTPVSAHQLRKLARQPCTDARPPVERWHCAQTAIRLSASTRSGTGVTPVSLFSKRPAACAVELMRNKPRRKWQVHYVVGRRRYSVSSHSDYERAYRDYGLARSRFNLFGGESFIKLMGRPAKRAIFNDPTTLLGKPRAR
jgi:hypothetical protein